MTCKCGDCFILACFSRLSHVNWNCLCYTVFGLVLARRSQNKLIGSAMLCCYLLWSGDKLVKFIYHVKDTKGNEISRLAQRNSVLEI